MWEWIETLARLLDDPLPGRMRPKLQRKLEVLEDRNRLGDIDSSVSLHVGRVGELTDPRVSRSGIIPAVGCLLRRLLRDFKKLNGNVGLQLLEQDPESRGHDTGSDEEDVCLHRRNNGILTEERFVQATIDRKDLSSRLGRRVT